METANKKSLDREYQQCVSDKNAEINKLRFELEAANRRVELLKQEKAQLSVELKLARDGINARTEVLPGRPEIVVHIDNPDGEDSESVDN